jgi:flagellar hook-length control protein FliK
MAIEVAPKAAAAPKTGAAPDTRNAKGAGKPEANAAAVGGFMAVLSGLEASTSEPSTTLAPVDAAVPAALDTATMTTTVDPASVDVGAATQPALTPSPADLGAAVVGAVAATMAAPVAALASTVPNAPAPNAPLPDVLAGGAPTSPLAKVATAFSTAGTDVPPQASRWDASGMPSTSNMSGTAGAASANARTKALARAAANQSDAAATATQPSASPESQMALRVHDVRWFAAMQAQRNPVSAAEVVVAQVNSNVNPERGATERYASAKQPTDLFAPGSTLETATAGQGPNAVSEMAPVAAERPESVKYWMSQDVQNAELQVDGLGSGPVEVHISLQGNEAHVAFRTDEVDTLSLLQGAGADLKESLQREGVVLLGVSVGTSGSHEGQGGERKPRQNVKIAQVAAAQSAPAQAAARPAGGVPRTVDLFV